MRPQVRILSLRPGAKIVHRKMNEQPIYLVAPPTGKVASFHRVKEWKQGKVWKTYTKPGRLLAAGWKSTGIMPAWWNGRRGGLKIRWWRHHVGSSPTAGTSDIKNLMSLRQLQQIQTVSLCYRFESDFAPCGTNSSIGRAKLFWLSCISGISSVG